jgi:copper transport protein
VGALILAGATQALIEVGSFGGLFGTTYGRLIMVKIGLVAVVIAVAAYSRRLVLRRTAQTRPRALRRAIFAELGVTVVILGVTSALVQIAPARSADAVGAVATSTTVSRTLTSDAFVLQADVFPAKVGNNSIHLYAYDKADKPLPVVEWVTTAALPAKGIEPIDVPLLRITDNHVIGDIGLPVAGDWTIKFTLRTSEIDQATVSMTVKVT